MARRGTVGRIEGLLQSLASVGDRLAGADARLLAVGLALQLAYLALRALAWRNVLRAAYPQARVRLLDVGCAYTAGVAVNGVAIGRAGDVVKGVLVRTRLPGSTFPGVVATLGVLSIFDLVAGALMLGLAWQLGAVPSVPLPQLSPLVLGVFAVLAVLLAAVGRLARPRLARALRGLRDRASCGVSVLRTPGRYVREVAAVQALAWAARVGVIFALLHAFHIPASLGDALLVLVLGGLASTLPSGPGGAGAQQLGVVVALAGTTTAAAALSFSIGMQVGISLANAAVGIAGGMVLFRSARPAVLFRRGRRLLATRDAAT